MKTQSLRQKTLTVLLCIALLFSSLSWIPYRTEAAANGTGQYKITANSGLRLRSEPSTTSAQLDLIPYNTIVNVTEVNGIWGKTTYNSRTGWISLDYATKIENGLTGTFSDKIEALQKKFPHGKYWSHTPGKSYSMDSYSSTPCSHHGSCNYTGKCGCNSFFEKAIQCHGFAVKLGYDVFGTDPYASWTKIYSADDIRLGDMVRYRNNGHTIFITGISKDTFTYADCNTDGKCGIRWNVTISRSTLKSTFTYVWRAGNYEDMFPPEPVAPRQPAYASVSLASDDYYADQTIKFIFSSDTATSYKLIVDKAAGGTAVSQTTSSTSYSCKLAPGLYSAHVTASNVSGGLKSEYINFAVHATRKDNLGQEFYALIKNNASGKILTEDHGVTQYAERKDATQIMKFQRGADGTYTITSLKTGLLLGVVEEGFTDGTALQFAAAGDAGTQSWRVEKQNGVYSLGAQCAPTLVLEMPNGDTADGKAFLLRTRNGQTPQAFTLQTISPVSAIAFASSSVVLAKGKTLQLKDYLKISPDSPYNPNLTYTSADPGIATVSADGVVTGKKEGSVKITVKPADGQNLSAKITIKVQAQQETYVTLRISYQKAIHNGEKTTIDSDGTKPFIIGGRTMIPLRFVGEKLGGKVKYVNSNEPITLTYGNKTVSFKLNSDTITITEGNVVTTQKLDVVAQLRGSRTFIPLRAISQALGFTVYYQQGTELIVVSNTKMSSAVRDARLAEGKAYIK